MTIKKTKVKFDIMTEFELLGRGSSVFNELSRALVDNSTNVSISENKNDFYVIVAYDEKYESYIKNEIWKALPFDGLILTNIK